MSECPNCKGTLWVCENHPEKAWEDECACGAGMPCVCNPEAIHPGSAVLVDRSGVDSEALLETVGTQDKRIAALEAENKRLREALVDLLKLDERNTCIHEETHRGGTLWEICDSCGQEWSDDRNPRRPWSDPPEWIRARAALANEEGR